MRPIKPFEGEQNSELWLSDYITTVQLANGDVFHAIKYLLIMLKGSAHAWLNTLPPRSIFCWNDIQQEFLDTFMGTYQRPANRDDLINVIQEDGETARQFLTLWLKKKNDIVDITDAEAITAFKIGVRDEVLT